MAYLALYRRFRPSGFDSLVGQDHVVRTLVNQIKTDKVGHAYLFCGARGTGKTSAAKIFARAINCLSPVNGSPCGKCEVCKALADGANLDIVEMDAASNNKVENVREIRDKIQYPPVSGRYKVYIIDEVHMLTTEAFNALLKTLEEPPKHAVFILATTEVHKLPATILSRCMRFDFRLIPTAQIAEHIAKIYREIGKDFEPAAVQEIARAGAGSIRDALSVADICVSYREGKLTYSDVLEVLGATDGEKILSLIGDIFAGNTGGVVKTVEELADSGKSVGVLCKDVVSALREIIVCKTCSDYRKILALPDDKTDKLVKLADKIDENGLLRIIEIFADAEGNLRYGSSPRAVFLTACIKASMPSADYNIDALLSRISALEKRLAEGDFSPAKPVFLNAEERKQPEVSRAAVKPQPEVSRAAVKPQPEPQPSWDDDFGVPLPPPEEEPAPVAPVFTGRAESKPAPQSVPTQRAERTPAAKTSIADNESAELKSAATSAPVGGMSAGRIWGTVVRKLRADRNIVLWVACQEMEAQLSGRTLKVIATEESGYNAVIKEQNLQTLIATVKTVGDYDVEVSLKKQDDGANAFESGVEQIKKTFGATTLEIKD